MLAQESQGARERKNATADLQTDTHDQWLVGQLSIHKLASLMRLHYVSAHKYNVQFSLTKLTHL
jgi:hypothetical protein